MHRKFLKSKVMAALFSAAFLLGIADSEATELAPSDINVDGTDIEYIVVKNGHHNEFGHIQVNSGTLTLTILDESTLQADYILPKSSNATVVINGGNVETGSILDASGTIIVEKDFTIKTILQSDTDQLPLSITAGGNILVGKEGSWVEWTGSLTAKSATFLSGLQASDLNVKADEGVFFKGAVEVSSKINGGTTTDITFEANSTLPEYSYVWGNNVTFTTDSLAIKEFNAAVNASTVSVTGDLMVTGDYTVSNQDFVGGLSLGESKIQKLADGDINVTSTDAVNGAQLYNLKIQGELAGGEDISISSANAISVNKAGSITADNTGIVSGGAVYSVASAIQTSLPGIASSVSKNQTAITSLQEGMSDLKSSVASINANVASTTKNLSSSLSSRLQADLGNLSDDGKSVIKNLISETLRGMNVSTIAVNEVSSAQSNVSSVSIMPAVENAAVDAGNGSSSTVSAGDIDGVYASLNDKVGATDFDSLKTDVSQNTTAIEVNAGNIKTNALAIDTLKSSKANVDGSNIDVAKYSEKLGTGKLAAGEAGLVTGGAVYSALDSKADGSYVEAGFGVMSNQLESVKQNVTHDMNRMGANAAALTSLHPQNYDSEDKLDFAAGYGHYHDSNATAIGAFYHPNAATMVSLAGTVGNGNSMVSAGLSFKLGMNANVKKVMITKKDFDKQQVENQKMKGHLDNQTARLQQMEAALSAMIYR